MTGLDSGARQPSDFPLNERFPELREIPRAQLCTLPSPVQKLDVAPGSADLWIKRDDLDAPSCGGNKVRSLEFLLGGVGPGDTVVTMGGAGSTHVLATAVHAARLGAKTTAYRWPHDMNPVAEIVSWRIASVIPGARVGWSAPVAMIRAQFNSIGPKRRYIPLGGAIPLGVLGHVNAALELAGQIGRGEMPMPERVVLPLGSGGTVAGLVLGFAVAGLDIEVVGVRVGPRLFVNRRRVMGIARRTAAFIEARTGQRLTGINPARLRIVHQFYGGAYGRPYAGAAKAAEILRAATGVRLDDTYSAKAWSAALDECTTAGGPVLFWLTFDPSCLTN